MVNTEHIRYIYIHWSMYISLSIHDMQETDMKPHQAFQDFDGSWFSRTAVPHVSSQCCTAPVGSHLLKVCHAEQRRLHSCEIAEEDEGQLAHVHQRELVKERSLARRHLHANAQIVRVLQSTLNNLRHVMKFISIPAGGTNPVRQYTYWLWNLGAPIVAGQERLVRTPDEIHRCETTDVRVLKAVLSKFRENNKIISAIAGAGATSILLERTSWTRTYLNL